MLRIRMATALALLLMLISSVTVFAKGSFSFITISSSGLKEPVRLTDPALTTDFFAFADFSVNSVKAPADPGAGYEITRYYVDQSRESAFDHLHYYPENGLVYYDGLFGGSTEYDGKWYTARPEIKKIFEAALSSQVRLLALGSPEAAQALVPPTEVANIPAQVAPVSPSARTQMSMIVGACAVILLALALWGFRKVTHR